MNKIQQQIREIYGKDPETLDEVAEAIIACISTKDKVVGFAWDISYADVAYWRTPNNGYQGTYKKTYPGFYGRVWIRFNDKPDFFTLSQNFDTFLSHPGTGGAGTYSGPWTKVSRSLYLNSGNTPECYSWDYRWYIEDWPGLSYLLDEVTRFNEAENEKVVWAKVSNKYYSKKQFSLSHNFLWNDPETEKNDQYLLNTLPMKDM